MTNLREITNFRDMVPVAGKSVYLNSSFQPPMNKVVYDSIIEFLHHSYNSCNSKPEFVAKCEETREKVAKFLNTEAQNIAFTRDTTEGLTVFQRSIKWSKGDNVVMLKNEHPNQGFGWLGLVSEGLEVRLVKTDESKLTNYNADSFAPYIDEHTRAIGISSVMFHSGLRNDIKSLVDQYKSKGIHILVDATQEVGFGKIDVKELGASAIAFGVHKGLSVPTGLGILYVEPETMKSLKDTPPILCGGSISNMNSDLTVKTDFEVFTTALRFEHLNKAMLQIIALGDYIDFIGNIGMENVQSYLEELGSYLRAKLRFIGIETSGADEPYLRSPQSNVIPLFGKGWSEYFSASNVYVSQYRCGTRISLALYNNKSDIDSFVEIVEQGLAKGLKIH